MHAKSDNPELIKKHMSLESKIMSFSVNIFMNRQNNKKRISDFFAGSHWQNYNILLID